MSLPWVVVVTVVVNDFVVSDCGVVVDETVVCTVVISVSSLVVVASGIL